MSKAMRAEYTTRQIYTTLPPEPYMPDADCVHRGPCPPLRLVGRTRPQIVKQGVLGYFVALLENRSVLDRLTGISAPMISPKTKLLLALGEHWSQKTIYETAQSFIDDAETNPGRWQVVRSAVPKALFAKLQTQGRESLIFDNRIISVPRLERNLEACETLGTMFSRAEILATPGFVEDDFGGIRLDVSYQPPRGFLFPVVERGVITGLRFFRSTDDERPFILRSRRSALA